MSGRGRRVDVRSAHTVAYLLRCPRSSVPEAMRASKFTLDESASRSKQMTIRRSFAKKATGGRTMTAMAMARRTTMTTMTTMATMTAMARQTMRTTLTTTTPTTLTLTTPTTTTCRRALARGMMVVTRRRQRRKRRSQILW